LYTIESCLRVLETSAVRLMYVKRHMVVAMGVCVICVQSGAEMWPRDDNGELIYEQNASFCETWEVRQQ